MDFSGSESEYRKETKVEGCTQGESSRISELQNTLQASHQHIKKIDTGQWAWIGDFNDLDYSSTSEHFTEDNKCTDNFALFLLRS